MNKKKVCDLAHMGGKPLFERPRPIGQLDMPPIEGFLKYVREIHGSKRFTNNGPFAKELELRLAEIHGTRYCVTVANATVGASMILRCLALGKQGNVIMPAFTYPGLPHIARWAGQSPSFSDVDPETHTLSVEAVDSVINEQTTAILAVCNTNYPGDMDGLEALAKKRKIPICFDSVNSFGASYKGKPIGGFGEAEVFSLHATKLLNGFEGGYITTNNEELAHTLSVQRNFGFRAPTDKSVNPFALGFNAKLNEFSAAMALCCLDPLAKLIAENKERYDAYCDFFKDVPGISFLPYKNAESEKYNYLMAIAEPGKSWPISRDNTVKLIRAENLLARAYYCPPLHQTSHCPKGLKVPPLPITENLAKRFIQMPVGSLVSISNIKSIAEFFKFMADNSKEINKHLMGQENH